MSAAISGHRKPVGYLASAHWFIGRVWGDVVDSCSLSSSICSSCARSSPALSCARSSSAPSRACFSRASPFSTRFSRASPSSACAARAPPGIRASRAPPSARSSRASSSARSSRAPSGARSSRAPSSARTSRASTKAFSSWTAPRGELSQETFFGGGYLPRVWITIVAIGKTLDKATMVHRSRPPNKMIRSWLPESPVPPSPPESLIPPWPPESPDPPWRLPQCSCPAPASRAPTPPPQGYYYGAGRAFREGEVMSRICLFCSLSSHNARPHLVSLEPWLSTPARHWILITIHYKVTHFTTLQCPVSFSLHFVSTKWTP